MSSQYWTTIIEREEKTDKTAMFDGENGTGALLSPFWILGANFAVPTSETQATLADRMKQEFLAKIPIMLKQEIEAHSNTVIGIDNIVVNVTWDKRAGGTWFDAAHLIFGMPLAQCGATVSWSCKVYTANAITESPFPPWGLQVLTAILNAIIIALVAYWVIQAAKDLIEAWTTTKTKITTIKPDGTTVIEETTKPDYGGLTIVIVGAVVVVIVIMAMMGFRGKRG